MGHADPVLLPADAAVATDETDFEVTGIFQRRERPRQRAPRRDRSSGVARSGVSIGRATNEELSIWLLRPSGLLAAPPFLFRALWLSREA